MEHYNDWFGNDWCGETRDEEWALIDAIKNSVRDAVACLWRAKLTVTRMIWVEKIG